MVLMPASLKTCLASISVRTSLPCFFTLSMMLLLLFILPPDQIMISFARRPVEVLPVPDQISQHPGGAPRVGADHEPPLAEKRGYFRVAKTPPLPHHDHRFLILLHLFTEQRNTISFLFPVGFHRFGIQPETPGEKSSVHNNRG